MHCIYPFEFGLTLAHAPATRERRASIIKKCHIILRHLAGDWRARVDIRTLAHVRARQCAHNIIIYRAVAPPLALQHEKGGAEHALKYKWNKWKNHFFKMKGDVGMV